jgi:hypothetical protein
MASWCQGRVGREKRLRLLPPRSAHGRHGLGTPAGTEEPRWTPRPRSRPAPEACLSGLTGVVAVGLPAPRFDSALLARLTNPEVAGLLEPPLRLALAEFLRTHPDAAEAIAGHVLHARPSDPRTGQPRPR